LRARTDALYRHAVSRPDPDTSLAPLDANDSPSFGTVLRDLLAFELKLLVDGLKDVVLAQAAVVATLLDLLRKRRGSLYGLMNAGERFESWLGLYRPMSGARRHDEDEEEDAPFGGANRALRAAEQKLRDRRSR
jgi:hypothetical protein